MALSPFEKPPVSAIFPIENCLFVAATNLIAGDSVASGFILCTAPGEFVTSL
jgi:hypothetical protein